MTSLVFELYRRLRQLKAVDFAKTFATDKANGTSVAVAVTLHSLWKPISVQLQNVLSSFRRKQKEIEKQVAVAKIEDDQQLQKLQTF